MYLHSTVQPRDLQYRKRSPDPHFRMKGEGETAKGLFENEPTILLAGNPDGYVYRRKYLGQSTHNRYELERLDRGQA